jgi:signal transduction histidine kinase
LLSLIALRDSNGQLVGAASARQPRDIAALGERAAAVALMLFAGMSALFALVLWALLRLGVLRRLERMEAHFNAQGEDPTPMPTDSALQDEITRLTDAYNALVHRSGESVRHARDAQRQRDAETTANRMKSDFLANISHELRTPLNHVIGYAELIGEDLEEGRTASCPADLQRITNAARHLLTLVNDILDLSKIEAGTLQLRPQAFDVAEMVREAVSVTSAVARERNCQISVEIQSGIGVAYSDQARLRQSLISALAHACSSSEGAPVRLTARRMPRAKGPDEIEFSVHCPSAVLSGEELERLFEPYADADTPSGHGGAGLGLSVTRRVLGLLGGTIEAYVDNGVAFILKAPVVIDDRARAVA